MGNWSTELISSGALGEVYLVDWIHRDTCQRGGIEYQSGSRWFMDRRHNGGGPVMDWGPYDFNVLLSLFEPVAVTVNHALCVHPRIPEPIPAGTVFDVETQAVASLTFELMGRPNVHVRYERASATHGEAMQTNAVYGSHGFMNWNWLPFGQDLKLSIRRTTGPNAAETEVIPADANHGPNWKLEPIMQFRAFLQGQTDAIGMFDARALHALRIIRAVYDSAETGRPVRVQLDEPRPAALSPI